MGRELRLLKRVTQPRDDGSRDKVSCGRDAISVFIDKDWKE
jgi:hypothetical protein